MAIVLVYIIPRSKWGRQGIKGLWGAEFESSRCWVQFGCWSGEFVRVHAAVISGVEASDCSTCRLSWTLILPYESFVSQQLEINPVLRCYTYTSTNLLLFSEYFSSFGFDQIATLILDLINTLHNRECTTAGWHSDFLWPLRLNNFSKVLADGKICLSDYSKIKTRTHSGINYDLSVLLLQTEYGELEKSFQDCVSGHAGSCLGFHRVMETRCFL